MREKGNEKEIVQENEQAEYVKYEKLLHIRVITNLNHAKEKKKKRIKRSISKYNYCNSIQDRVVVFISSCEAYNYRETEAIKTKSKNKNKIKITWMMPLTR